MLKVFKPDTVQPSMEFESLSEFTDFIDTLSNGVYTFVLGAATVQNIGLSRGTAIMQAFVNSSNFAQVHLYKFDTMTTDHRIYKVSGTWQSEWTACIFSGGGNKCLTFFNDKMGVAA